MSHTDMETWQWLIKPCIWCIENWTQCNTLLWEGERITRLRSKRLWNWHGRFVQETDLTEVMWVRIYVVHSKNFPSGLSVLHPCTIIPPNAIQPTTLSFIFVLIYSPLRNPLLRTGSIFHTNPALSIAYDIQQKTLNKRLRNTHK